MTWFLAWPYAEAGRLEEAAALIARVGGAELRGLAGGYARLYSSPSSPRPPPSLGDRELARRLYDELLPYRTQIVLGQVSAIGPAAHYLGVLASTLGLLRRRGRALRFRRRVRRTHRSPGGAHPHPPGLGPLAAGPRRRRETRSVPAGWPPPRRNSPSELDAPVLGEQAAELCGATLAQ